MRPARQHKRITGLAIQRGIGPSVVASRGLSARSAAVEAFPTEAPVNDRTQANPATPLPYRNQMNGFQRPPPLVGGPGGQGPLAGFRPAPAKAGGSALTLPASSDWPGACR